MSIKLIALDIDDTLLDSQNKILPSTKKALDKALDKGIKVVLCSGRPLAGVSPYLEELNISGKEQYVITYNGGLVETASGDILSRKIIDNQGFKKIVGFATEKKIPYYFLDDQSNVYTADKNINRFTIVQAWENKAGIFVRTPQDFPDDFEITKVAVVGEKDQLDQYEQPVKDQFGNDYYVVRAGDNFIEIMNPTANKGTGLETLVKILGFKKDEIMAFGDEQNDLPMFDYVGHAIAMGNGSDVAKERADYVTDSNDNDGIAKALDKLVFND